MRRAPTLLLAATLACHGACFAQSRVPVADDTADATLSTPAAVQHEPRSAFGKVIAVMIRSLQHQSNAPAHAAAPVRTTAAGTPMGIEVGANFRDALKGGMNAGRQTTGTGGAPAATVPRVAPPEDPALRQVTLAGPG